jgi:hypothetical protein
VHSQANYSSGCRWLLSDNPSEAEKKVDSRAAGAAALLSHLSSAGRGGDLPTATADSTTSEIQSIRVYYVLLD